MPTTPIRQGDATSSRSAKLATVSKRRNVPRGQEEDLSALARAYWEYERRSDSPDKATRLSANQFFDTWQEVRDRTIAGDELAIRLLVALVEAASSEQELCRVGAGPLENVINAKWRDGVLVDPITGWATRLPRFAAALACVWYSDDLPRPLIDRLQRAARA